MLHLIYFAHLHNDHFCNARLLVSSVKLARVIISRLKHRWYQVPLLSVRDKVKIPHLPSQLRESVKRKCCQDHLNCGLRCDYISGKFLYNGFLIQSINVLVDYVLTDYCRNLLSFFKPQCHYCGGGGGGGGRSLGGGGGGMPPGGGGGGGGGAP